MSWHEGSVFFVVGRCAPLSVVSDNRDSPSRSPSLAAMSMDQSFITLIENHDAGGVLRELTKGVVSPNKSFQGVYPLARAIELGDTDIAVLLLEFKGDATLKPSGPNAVSAIELSKRMTADDECEYQMEASVICDMINDPAKRKMRYESALKRIRKKDARDRAVARQSVAIAVMVCALVFIYFYFH